MRDELDISKHLKRTEIAKQRGKEMIVEHISPVPDSAGFIQTKKKIEEALYELFQKYEGS